MGADPELGEESPKAGGEESQCWERKAPKLGPVVPLILISG